MPTPPDDERYADRPDQPRRPKPPPDEDDRPRRPRLNSDDEDRPRRPRLNDHRDDMDDDDRPRRRRRDEDDGTQFIVPTNVSPLAIGSCYLGLIGFCLPGIGLLFALPALIMAIIALSKAKKMDSYGGATSNIRAVIGLILGGLGTLLWGAAIVYFVFLE